MSQPKVQSSFHRPDTVTHPADGGDEGKDVSVHGELPAELEGKGKGEGSRLGFVREAEGRRQQVEQVMWRLSVRMNGRMWAKWGGQETRTSTCRVQEQPHTVVPTLCWPEAWIPWRSSGRLAYRS